MPVSGTYAHRPELQGLGPACLEGTDDTHQMVKLSGFQLLPYLLAIKADASAWKTLPEPLKDIF